MDIKNKIKYIKFLRMKPQEIFIYNIITNLEEFIDESKNDNIIYYKYNNKLLFEYNLNYGYFWCHYKDFWMILEIKFNLNDLEIKKLVKYMIEEHLIKKEVTPFPGKSVTH